MIDKIIQSIIIIIGILGGVQSYLSPVVNYEIHKGFGCSSPLVYGSVMSGTDVLYKDTDSNNSETYNIVRTIDNEYLYSHGNSGFVVLPVDGLCHNDDISGFSYKFNNDTNNIITSNRFAPNLLFFSMGALNCVLYNSTFITKLNSIVPTLYNYQRTNITLIQNSTDILSRPQGCNGCCKDNYLYIHYKERPSFDITFDPLRNYIDISTDSCTILSSFTVDYESSTDGHQSKTSNQCSKRLYYAQGNVSVVANWTSDKYFNMGPYITKDTYSIPVVFDVIKTTTHIVTLKLTDPYKNLFVSSNVTVQNVTANPQSFLINGSNREDGSFDMSVFQDTAYNTTISTNLSNYHLYYVSKDFPRRNLVINTYYNSITFQYTPNITEMLVVNLEKVVVDNNVTVYATNNYIVTINHLRPETSYELRLYATIPRLISGRTVPCYVVDTFRLTTNTTNVYVNINFISYNRDINNTLDTGILIIDYGSMGGDQVYISYTSYINDIPISNCINITTSQCVYSPPKPFLNTGNYTIGVRAQYFSITNSTQQQTIFINGTALSSSDESSSFSTEEIPTTNHSYIMKASNLVIFSICMCLICIYLI